MQIDIITIFPEICDFYFKHSLLGKSCQKGLLKLRVHNLRDFAADKHKTACPSKCGVFGQVDDKPFGGGRGMVLKIEPLWRAVQFLKKSETISPKYEMVQQPHHPEQSRRTNPKSKIQNPKRKNKVVLFTPRGKKFNQKMATKWSGIEQLILICGRYEGIDERAAKHLVNEQVSIGDYVLMGGELPALIVVEAVARLLPGVVGHSESLISERITKSKGFLEYPQYTRPEVFEPIPGKKWRVPKILLSGNHKEIEKWRKEHSVVIE